MCRIEVRSIKCENYKYMENTCNYVAKSDRCLEGYIGATNALLPRDRTLMAKVILNQMKAVHTFYQQEDSRLGLHVCVAFSDSELRYLDKERILRIGYNMVMQEFPECITYFSVHDHTDHLHLDMLVNTVMIHSGRMYGCGTGGWRGIGYRVHDAMKYWIPESEISDLQVSFDGKEQ